MMRKMRFAFVFLFIAAATLLWITGIAPSGNRVEIHPPPGEAVHVGCGFGFSFKAPTKEGGTLALPVGYGKALFQVTFSDGQTV